MITAVVVLAVVALVGASACTGSSSDPTASVAATTSTAMAGTTATSASTGNIGTGTSSSSSSVRTEAGTITVRGANGELDVVDVDTAAGWTEERTRQDATHLVVSFTRKGGRVDVTIELTPSGIVTSTRSVTTG